MRLTKSSKKVMAIVSAVALTVAGISYNPAQSEGAIINGSKWECWSNDGGTISSSSTAGFTLSNLSVGTTWWNIQTWVSDVYMISGYTYTASFKLVSSTPKYFTVDAKANDAQYFAQPTMDKWVSNGDGTYTYNYESTFEATSTFSYDFRVSFGYNDKNTSQADSVAQNQKISVTMSDFDIERVATEGQSQGEEITTPPPVELPDGYALVAQEKKDGTVTSLGVFESLYQGGSWANAWVAYKGAGTDSGDLSVMILSSNNAAGSWGIQLKYPTTGLDSSKEYTFKAKYNSTKAGTMFVKLEGVNDGLTSTANAGDNTYAIDFKGVGSVNAVFELSGFPADTVIDFESITVTEKGEEVESTTPAGEVESTTPAGEATNCVIASWTTIGDDGWTYYINSSATSATVVGGTSFEDGPLFNVVKNNWWEYDFQLKSPLYTVGQAGTYTITLTNVESGDTSQTWLVVEDENGNPLVSTEQKPVVPGAATDYTAELTLDAGAQIRLVYLQNYCAGGTKAISASVELQGGEVETTTPAQVVETTTPSEVVETTTPSEVVETTTPSEVVETTTPAEVVETTTPSEVVETTTPSEVVETTTPSEVVETTTPAEVVETTTPAEVVETTTPSGGNNNPTQAPTTQAPTTQAPTTQAPTTTVAPTTVSPTTTAPATTAAVKLAKGKIAKASRAKNGKKVKLTFKKIKGATSYEIKISTSKKFKKGTKTYTSKKLSKTIKKLVATKKYYVKVRAVAVAKDGTVTEGKWSKVKTIKVKK
jgi:hypothetical protein